MDREAWWAIFYGAANELDKTEHTHIHVQYFCMYKVKPRLTLRDPMDCNLPGSSVHQISQARILEWIAISFSRGSSRLRD